MLHEPAAPRGKDPASPYKMRLGVWLFVPYAALYFLGFVGLNVLRPTLMETPIVFGLNLAVAFGFGLIILALVMALIYNQMCSHKEAETDAEAENGEGN